VTRAIPALALAVVVAGVAGIGCRDQAHRAIERLETAVADYEAGKSEPTEPQIDALFAQVDADTAKLRADAAVDPRGGAGSEAAELQRRTTELRRRYVAARVERLRGAAEDTVRDVGKEIGRSLEEAGRRMQESMEKH
jgi:hypothetical protein